MSHYKAKGVPMPNFGKPPSSSWWCVPPEQFMAARAMQLERITSSEFANKLLSTAVSDVPEYRPKPKREFAS